MKKYSKLICTILTVCMMLTILPFCAFAASDKAVSFNDIKGSWAEEYILYWSNTLSKDGKSYVIGGYADGSFKPDENITRGAVAAILDRAYGFSESGATKDFTDVPKTNTFYKNIMACADNGVINGYADGSFKPANSITRQAAIAMIARCAMDKDSYKQYSDKAACKKLLSEKFKDAGLISEQFYAEFCYMCTYGNLEGYGDGTVRPGQNITRAQFVKLLYSSINGGGGGGSSVVPGKTYTLKATLSNGTKSISSSATKLNSDASIVEELMGIAVANSADISKAFPSTAGSKSLNAFISLYKICDEEGWTNASKSDWKECIGATGDSAIINACSDPESATAIDTLSCNRTYKVNITDDAGTYELTVTLIAE